MMMKYKHLISITLSLLVATIWISCSSDKADGVKFSSELLKVSDTPIDLSKDGDTKTIPVETNCEWSVTPNASNWSDLEVSADSKNITIKTGENPLRSERTATLSITTKGGLKKNITLRQVQGDAYIRVEEGLTLTFDENEGNRSFQVQSNTRWKVEASYTVGDANWLTYDTAGEGTKTVTVSAQRAITDVERKATITITSTEEGVNVSRSIQVIQDGLSFIELEVSPKQLEFSCIGGEPQVITIEKSNAQWWTTLIPIEPEEEEVSWLKLNKTNDIGTSTIQVTCTDNTTLLQRRATIVFSSGNKNGGVPQRVNIMQAAATLPVISDFSLRSKGDIMETAMFSFAFESAFPVTEYGLCYSTENNLPTADDEHVSQNADAKSMTGITMETGTLQPRKTYYVRAYAKSVVGVNYSTNVLAIETLGDAPGKGDNPPLFVPKR